MKKNTLKRIVGGTVSAMMIAASMPLSTSAGGFGWGGNGGGMDWSGFAGGFNDTNNNVGGDAGNGGNAKSGLNAEIKNDMPTTVPNGVEQKSQCKVENKTYMCKYTGKQKKCNVILPPNYNSSKKYPVMFVLHGIMGSENDMVSGMGVQELMTGLMSSGKSEEFIVVTPNMFTSKTMNGPSGINQQTCAEYDNFLYDVTESLLPFIKENYSVKEGRENTAITGFSMGGREAIYCGLMRPDVFGYVGGACPAPGITPGSDMYMQHPGCMQESEMKFRDVGPEPAVFMITGGTNDSVVGTFPKQYSDILTRNGVNHVYQSIPGGGHGAESVKPHLYTFMRYAFKGSESSVVTTTTTTTTTAVTTTTVTTTAAPVATTTVDLKAALNEKVTVWGDANIDGLVDMSDVVAIMQSLANPNKYFLSDQGKYNGDVSEAGAGITSNDALSIQKFLLGLVKTLPESYSSKLDGGVSVVTTTTTNAPEIITTTVVPVASASIKDNFDSGVGDWAGRGAASVDVSDNAYYGASGKSLLITDRSAEWNGAAINLGSDFQPGQTYSISLAALQMSGSSADIQISLQQGGNGGGSAVYTSIAKATCESGVWTKIENTSFTIPDNAGDMIFYVETVESSGDLMDFYIDDVLVAAEGTKSSVTTGGAGKVPEVVIPPTPTVDTTKWDNYKETASAQYIDFYKSSIKHMGNTYRLTQKLTAAESGSPLTVAYLGGSITEGKNYTTPFSNYLKTTFAKGSFKEINAGLSGTSSVVGLVRSEKQIVEQKPDIIFLEFSVNDHEDIMYKKCFESCIKKFLDMPNEPAVGIIITRAKGGFSSQSQMYPIGKNFDIPVISMDDALTKAFNSNFLQPGDYYTDEYHPHQKGGQLVADCMAYYVRQALKSENQSAGYTQPTKYVYGAEYANCVNVDPKNLTGFNAGSWKSGGGYNNNPGLNYSYTLNGGSPMTFKTQGKGLIIVFKANSSGMGSINVTVNGKTTKVNGNKQYTWGGPDAELGYYQDTTGDLDVSISGSGSFTIWGIGLVK
ncbi:MAG: carbohydrate binding domain-containing protein [Ruminococcus sp.]|uniref:carbohydrate binding domain-containing protein n=1 Tax=Ruminococcus sp. TaxID=41978 RepID=UPI0026006D86|nr:carbohydrate binding domain-containing protein [Ruminococcus sp.]MCR4795793.1 carbohydrate binding domain-containing protein [Ruminococcus sp.]